MERPSNETKKGDSKGPSKGVYQGKTNQTSSITIIALIRDFCVLVFNFSWWGVRPFMPEEMML